MQDLTPSLIETIEVGNTLGECVIWDDWLQSIWWTDIEQRVLYRYEPAQRKLQQWPTPERLCSFGLTTHEEILIAAFADGIALFEPGLDRIDWLARPAFARERMRMNDGRVDRQGRFWVGAMHEDIPLHGNPAAALYLFGTDQSFSEHETGIQISNSLCWSPDGRTMYFADSASREIRAYDFDTRRGGISNRRPFAEMKRPGAPDGSTVDADGRVWNAQWGAGRVVAYAPDGSEFSDLAVPARQPTCVAFGGAALTHLFVTSARQGMSEEELAAQPGAGHLFIYETAFTGIAEPRFAI